MERSSEVPASLPGVGGAPAVAETGAVLETGLPDTLAGDERAPSPADGAPPAHSGARNPPDPTPPPADPADDALNTLLHRMRQHSSFPSLSRSVARIQRIAGSDTESLASLASEILQDVALTQKLLRMVNTVHFKHLGAGGISTVSRAVALVGFAGIRNMALSLVLLEGLRDHQQADRLRDGLVRSLFAAQFARQLAASGHAQGAAQPISSWTAGAADAEEAYLAALFHDLGRLLTGYYLPAEAQAIERLCQPDTAAAEAAAPLTPEQAARRVLGLGFEALGLAVAKSWGLPEGLRSTLRRPEGRAPQRPVRAGNERQRWRAALANDMALAMQLADSAAARRDVQQLADQHARALDCSAADIISALEEARLALLRLAPALGLLVRPQSPTHRLLHFSLSAAAPEGRPPGPMPGPAADLLQTAAAAPPAGPAREDVAELLTAGIQDVMSSLASDHVQINTVLRMVLETLLRALHLRRVVFCLRDPASQHITGRFGLGADVARVVPRFDIAARAAAGGSVDLFSAVCMKAVDTVIADAGDPALQQRLPAWYGPELAAPSFLLLPLVMKGSTFGLIYADALQAQALVLAEREMALVRTLRSQAVMAFRHAG